MSYAVQSPAGAERQRPFAVTLAATLLAVMAVAGLGYAVATLAIAPGTVSRFRAGAGDADPADVEGFSFLVWAGAGISLVVALVLCALYAALAVGLRRGSNAARVTTWVLCVLGLVAGCGSAMVVAAQRGSGSGGVLLDAYPTVWIGLNITLAVAQMLGYAAVACLLLVGGAYFTRPGVLAEAPAPGPYGAYGSLPGMPGLYTEPGAPGGGLGGHSGSYAGQPHPGQPHPGQPHPGQPHPGQYGSQPGPGHYPVPPGPGPGQFGGQSSASPFGGGPAPSSHGGPPYPGQFVNQPSAGQHGEAAEPSPYAPPSGSPAVAGSPDVVGPPDTAGPSDTAGPPAGTRPPQPNPGDEFWARPPT